MCLCKAGGLAYVKGEVVLMYQSPRYPYDLPLSHLIIHVPLHSATPTSRR